MFYFLSWSVWFVKVQQWNMTECKTRRHDGLYWLSKRGQGTSLSCTGSFLPMLTLEPRVLYKTDECSRMCGGNEVLAYIAHIKPEVNVFRSLWWFGEAEQQPVQKAPMKTLKIYPSVMRGVIKMQNAKAGDNVFIRVCLLSNYLMKHWRYVYETFWRWWTFTTD